MSGKLTELVHNLKVQSQGASRTQPRRYQDALAAYWAQEPVKAVQELTALLADEPDTEGRFAAYRLWIECLAETRDTTSLKALRDHLFVRGQAEPDDHSIYAALRGVVHFELDEFGAARLLARAFEGENDNAYGLELVQLVEARVGGADVSPALADCTSPIDDYCHWQTLARGLLRIKAEEANNEALEHLRNEFRGAPLPHMFEYQRCVEAGFYAGAALVAERLVELYPDSLDYRYYQAYALFEDGDYPTARKLLNEAVNRVGESDAEIVGLLGHCHAKLGNPERAAHFLRTAVSLLKEQGMPTSHISLELANVEDEMRGDKLDPAIEMPRLTRNWLIKLSPRRYNELLSSSESAIDRLLRPMGREPRQGDYCFFASESQPDNQGRALWKIVAIYAVDSEPMWHPTQNYHSALKLVKRLPEGIPVDVETRNEEEQANVQEVAKGSPLHYGVFELDIGALTIIEEAARMHRDDMIERRRNGQSRRPTA